MNQEQPISLVAEASETAAIGVDPSGDGHPNQDDESSQESGDEEGAGPAEDACDEQGAAEDFDPGEDESRHESDLMGDDPEILDVLSEFQRVADLEDAGRKEGSADD